MSILLSDSEISALIAETKQLEPGYLSRLQLRPKQGHKERELDITGESGSEFRLILRQNLLNVLDFSVILGYSPKSSSQLFRLRRYNGKATSIRTKSNGRLSMTFTFTSPLSGTSILD